MFEALLRLFPRKSADLEAKLQGVNGFTGRGEIEYAAWSSGARALEVELRGVAGRSAEVYADGAPIAEVNLDNGRVDRTFATQRGDSVPELIEGARIDVRQNGDIILEGVLIPD
ncbi:MAG: hypothetical protein ACX939_04580 [Hyphococcus sp.]